MRLTIASFDELASFVGPDTRLVACSDVSWVTGRRLDSAALSATGVEILLDGAQGLGAVPVDVRALGCHYYAASGQKWLCGPNGIGYLYVRADRVARLAAPWPGYHALEEPGNALDSRLHADARRLGTGFPRTTRWSGRSRLSTCSRSPASALSTSAERAGGLACRAARRARRAAGPRARGTLVSFEAPDPPGLVERLAAEGFVLRSLPGTPYARASVGAWSSEDELERLADA